MQYIKFAFGEVLLPVALGFYTSRTAWWVGALVGRQFRASQSENPKD